MQSYRRTIRDPDLVETIKAIRASGLTIRGVSYATGISESCLRNWLSGKTKRPQNITITFVLRACGFERKLIKTQKGLRQ